MPPAPSSASTSYGPRRDPIANGIRNPDLLRSISFSFLRTVADDRNDSRSLTRGVSGRRDNHRPFRNPLEDFDAIAVVAPDGDLLKMHDLVGRHDGDL